MIPIKKLELVDDLLLSAMNLSDESSTMNISISTESSISASPLNITDQSINTISVAPQFSSLVRHQNSTVQTLTEDWLDFKLPLLVMVSLVLLYIIIGKK